jgi:hypothetical protein
VGNHHRRNARRGLFLFGMFCWRQEDRITLCLGGKTHSLSRNVPGRKKEKDMNALPALSLRSLRLCENYFLFFFFLTEAQRPRRRKRYGWEDLFLCALCASVRNSLSVQVDTPPRKAISLIDPRKDPV